jgi:Cation transporter/ATPase, N-terminus
VETRFGTDAEGLSVQEAARRLEQFGPNQLEEEPPTSGIVLLCCGVLLASSLGGCS